MSAETGTRVQIAVIQEWERTPSGRPRAFYRVICDVGEQRVVNYTYPLRFMAQLQYWVLRGLLGWHTALYRLGARRD